MILRAWAAASLLSGVLPLAAAAAGDTPPNVLVLHTDEHNFRTLGCYRALLPPGQAFMWGKAVVETPHVDSIATRGAVCTRFYATTPVCSPSRSAFVSGRYPQNTPVVTNDIPMDGGIVTFAEVLRRQGYATGYAGKWHLDGGGKPQWAPERHFGFADNRYLFNRGHWKKLEETAEGPRVAARQGGKPTYAVDGADEKSFTTDFLADRAVDFIGANRDKPFCYMVSFPDPHGPDTVRAPYDTMFKGQTYEKPRSYDKPEAGLPSWGQKTSCGFAQDTYYGMVKCIDDNVGKILDALRRHGLLERTVVVFTSDHGDLRGEHARQNKGVPYEGSARIPFVIAAPGRIPPGTVVREALSCVDFLPTLMPLMGIRVPAEVKAEGRDASALFVGGKAPAGWEDVAFLRGTGGPEENWLAAVSSRYKLVLAPSDEPWLFDLEADPDELVNRFRDPACREVVRHLAQALLAYGDRCRDPRVGVPRIRADLEWAVNGSGDYQPPKAAADGRVPKKGGRKARGGGASPDDQE